VKYAAIASWADEKQFPVTFMCAQLGLARQGYYRWLAKGPSARERTDAELTEQIRRIHAELRGDPDVRRVWAEHVVRGVRVATKRELAAVVHRITRQSMEQRLKHPKDLGETMVIAHAVVVAEAGETVTVLIDDGPGARTATAEISRLRRLHASGRAVGSIRLVSTLTVLELAAGR